MKRKSDMRQTSNIIVIQPIITKEEFVTEAPLKLWKFVTPRKQLQNLKTKYKRYKQT